MAELLLTVAGRAYRLACRDDDVPALRLAASAVDARATELAGQLGAVGESRLLLMTALSFAGDPAQPAPAAPAAGAAPELLERLAERLEGIARHLERAAAAH